MGMYTQLNLTVSFKKDTPQEVISFIDIMCDKEVDIKNVNPKAIPNHDLFKTQRWSWMFNSCSYYVNNINVVHWEKDYISKSYNLHVVCEIKNYDSEIEKLIDYIKEYSKNEFMGYYMYEENDEPILIYKSKDYLNYE